MSGKLTKGLVYEYAQALQVLDLAKREALSPYVACLLGTIFNRSEKQNCLEDIREWLFNYIAPYLYSDPRDQADLREKTLAISTYYLVENPNDQKYLLPNEFLNNYLDYASKQDWYGDSFLAFTVGMLLDRNAIYKKALDYFKRRYTTFLEQQNIEAISEALFLLPDLEESDRESGLKIIRTSIANPNAQIYEKSWGLIGIVKSKIENDIVIKSQLVMSLYNEISRSTTSFFSNLISLDTEAKVGKFNKINKDMHQKENLVVFNEDVEETQVIQSSNIDVAELGLITLSILLSNNYYHLYVSGIAEEQIVEFINSENKSEKGFVQISKPANAIGNVLAIIFTIMAGALASFYLFGIRVENNHIISTSTPALSDLLILPVWADYLLSQIQAVIRGESALEGMKEIPLLRHLLHLRKKKDVY